MKKLVLILMISVIFVFQGCRKDDVNLAPVASNVTQSGTVEAEQILTGSYTYSDAENDKEGTSAFQWYRASDSQGTSETAISGATAKTYTLTTGDVGLYIRFSVTPVATKGSASGTLTKASSFAGPVLGKNQAPVATSVSQSGTAQVGQTLTGSYTYSDAENDPQGTSTFKWYRADNGSGLNETAISGATAKTYTLAATDNGKYIRFAVIPVAQSGATPGTEVKAGSWSGPVTTPNLAPVATSVNQTGTAQVGQILTGTYTYSDPENDPQGNSTFKWYRADNGSGLNETAISGATAKTYTLAATDNGKYIRFAVIPVAQSGATPGTEVKAANWSGPVTTPNLAPVAFNVSQSGTAEVGQDLTGSYIYSDAENDPESFSSFQWYRADNNSGLNETAIYGATGKSYTLIAEDAGKYIRFAVTPAAQSGNSPGSKVKAAVWSGPVTTANIACDNDISEGSGAVVHFMYDMDGNGSAEYNWCAREVQAAGHTWLDRNLGASRPATSFDDASGFGDYYQWGRGMDGHQNPGSATTTNLSPTNQPGHGLFIISSGSPYDWRDPANGNLWQGSQGINNPCPVGWRVPAVSEFQALDNSFSPQNYNGSMASPVKLPAPGVRMPSCTGGLCGSVNKSGEWGYYWSSTTIATDYGYDSANVLGLGSSYSIISTQYSVIYRGMGMPVRCIKN